MSAPQDGSPASDFREPYRSHANREAAAIDGATVSPFQGPFAALAVGGALDQHYGRLLGLLPIAVYACDAPSGVITFYNQQAAALWGRAPQVGDTDERFCGSFRLWRPDGSLLPHDQTPMALALSEGSSFRNEEVVIERPDGSRITVLVNIDPVRDPEGRIIGAINAYQDTTSLKLAENKLREREERYELVLAGAGAGIWDWDVVAKRVVFSPAWKQMRGFEEGDISDSEEEWTNGIHPEDRERVLHAVQAHFEGRTPVFAEEYRIRHKSGRWIWILDRGIAQRDSTGRVVRMAGSETDITERKRAEEVLRRITEQLLIVTDAMAVPVAHCTHELRFAWVSRAYAELIGRPADELIERPIAEVLGQEGFSRIYPNIQRVLAGEIVRSEHQVPFPERGLRWVDVSYTPTWDPQGECDGWVAVVIDITERKSAEQALREADRRRNEFLAILAHELRNPLAPIRNGLQLLKLARGDVQTVEQCLAMMERQMAHMVRLVDDLMDTSRITLGKLVLRKERVELARIVQQAIETSRPLIDAQGHELALDLSPCPIYVDADVTRLSQAVDNLLNNAAKYTERGGRITLAIRLEGDNAIVSVRDTGIGIPADMLPRLFDMFAQMDHSPGRLHSGLGIGLALVKRLVELHGGTVEAHSEGSGRGSEFVIRLPLALPVDQNEGDYGGTATASARSHRILVVDDNRDAAQSLATMLELKGNETQTAFNGGDALGVAAAFRPDVILMDIGMPGLNGYEVAQRIRQQPWGRNVLLVAVSGWGQENDKKRSSDAGFNAHLVKPVELSAIEELLAGVV